MNVGAGSITIGRDCLFAAVKFRSTDSHFIFDCDTGDRLNPDGPIFVGDNVWLAEDVLLLRNATVGSGSVVGARSMVAREIPENSLAAGSPAKVIRSNIRWQQ